MATSTCTPDADTVTFPSRLTKSVSLSYGCTIFLGALLLFQVQLVLGKYILPFFGGAPSVWNTCMLFFQTLLLLGYGYAHFVSLQKNPRFQSFFHSSLLLVSLGLLAFYWMKGGSPLASADVLKQHPVGNPVLWILQYLSVAVGLPFFLLSSTGPLLQKWFSRISSETPYRLYALSNAGSLLGLVSYPFFFEWTLTLKHQAQFWFATYALFVILCLVTAWRFSASISPSEEENSAEPEPLDETGRARPNLSRYLLWVALATCSSTMLLATTNLLCQDIAVIPLLWVWPLCVYLFSFILVFSGTQWYSRRICWPLYFVSLGAALKVSFFPAFIPKLPLQLAAYSLALFAVCMVCHGELALSKPGARHLTSFYCMLALGGALGGLFVVLFAPQIFRGFAEFQAALFACGFLLIVAFLMQDSGLHSDPHLWDIPLVVLVALSVPRLPGFIPGLSSVRLLNDEVYATYYTGALALVLLLFRRAWGARAKSTVLGSIGPQSSWRPITSFAFLGILAIITCFQTFSAIKDLTFQDRNFFGIKYVRESTGKIFLMSGSILHGGENSDPRMRDIPTLYFSKTSGIGLLLANHPRGISGQEPLRVGVIGLGAGTLAAYGKPGDYFRFYEIDPAMIRISSGARPFFHFVEDSRATVQIVEGDGRLSLQREAEQGNLQQFDVFVADGFSGDAVPVHLLTREAMGVYVRHLRGPDSVVAFNISNRYLNLAPVVAGLAESYHLQSRRVCDGLSLWILLSKNPAMLDLPHLAEKSGPILGIKSPLLWTDDYSNLFQVVQFTPNCPAPS